MSLPPDCVTWSIGFMSYITSISSYFPTITQCMTYINCQKWNDREFNQSRKCVSWYFLSVKQKNGKIDNQKLHESSDYSEQRSNEEGLKEGESYYHTRHNTKSSIVVQFLSQQKLYWSYFETDLSVYGAVYVFYKYKFLEYLLLSGVKTVSRDRMVNRYGRVLM